MIDWAMGILILGLVLFIGIHVFTTLRGARQFVERFLAPSLQMERNSLRQGGGAPVV